MANKIDTYFGNPINIDPTQFIPKDNVRDHGKILKDEIKDLVNDYDEKIKDLLEQITDLAATYENLGTSRIEKSKEEKEFQVTTLTRFGLVLGRAKKRFQSLWEFDEGDAFTNEFQSARKDLFGIYKYRGYSGYAYVNEISAEQLQDIIFKFDENMAQLTFVRRKAIMDIAAQTYLSNVEKHISSKKNLTKIDELDSKINEYDEQFMALYADQYALEAMKKKVIEETLKAEIEITKLRTEITDEKMKFSQAERDLKKVELDDKKAYQEFLLAGQRGIEIQFEIDELAVKELELLVAKHEYQQKKNLIPAEKDKMNAKESLLSAEENQHLTQKGLLDSELAELKNQNDRIKSDTKNKKVDFVLFDVDYERAKLKPALIDVELKELDVKIKKEEIKVIELETEKNNVEAQIEEVKLDVKKVGVQLAEIDVDIALIKTKEARENLLKIDKEIINLREINTSSEITAKKEAQLALIESDVSILKAKIAASEAYAEIEGNEQINRKYKLQAEHDFRIAMTALDKELSIHKADTKITSYSEDLEIAKDQEEYHVKEDKKRITVPASQIQAAQNASNAAIDAAKTMASADILNTLTHKIGAA